MITGVHTMFYSSEPEQLRAFLRDKLGFPYTDVGEGWLIFDMPDAEMGCHPAENMDGQRSGTHYISFYCDNIAQTVAELKSKGVEFTDDVQNVGYGLITHFKMPGDFQVQLYQPRYQRNPKPTKQASAKRAAAAQKALPTRKRRQSGAKAALTPKRRKTGRKATPTRASRKRTAN